MTVPVYLRLKEDILEKIRSGAYPQDTRLPSENELALTWGMSRMTVRRALDELTRDGYLYRTRGSGTFVAGSRFSQCDIMSFTEMARQKGVKPETVVLEKVFACDDEIALALHLPKGTVFFTVTRLRKADGAPVGVERVFLPMQSCERPDRLELTGSLYEGLRRLCGWTVARQDLSLSAAKPTKAEAELLGLSRTQAVMRTEGVSLDGEGRALFYERNTYSGASYVMNVSISSRWGRGKQNEDKEAEDKGGNT